VDLGGTSDVSNVTGQVQNGTTTISFTIPLDSGDPNDIVYAKGNQYKVILAYGPNGANDVTSYHGGGGRFITDLTL